MTALQGGGSRVLPCELQTGLDATGRFEPDSDSEHPSEPFCLSPVRDAPTMPRPERSVPRDARAAPSRSERGPVCTPDAPACLGAAILAPGHALVFLPWSAWWAGRCGLLSSQGRAHPTRCTRPPVCPSLLMGMCVVHSRADPMVLLGPSWGVSGAHTLLGGDGAGFTCPACQEVPTSRPGLHRAFLRWWVDPVPGGAASPPLWSPRPPFFSQWSLYSSDRPGSVTRLAAALGSGAHFPALDGVPEEQWLTLLKTTSLPFMERSRPRRSPQPSPLCTSVFRSPDFKLCSCRPRAAPMASRDGQPWGRPTGSPESQPGGQAPCSPRETHGTQG